MQLIDGKKISKEIKDELKEEVAVLKANGREVCLAVVQVGNDLASSVYVNNKKKACAYIGIESESYELAEETTEEELLLLIDRLNKEEHVNGILVQLPLPAHIDEDKIIRAISPTCTRGIPFLVIICVITPSQVAIKSIPSASSNECTLFLRISFSLILI